jgi:UDP-N-acetylmuramate dehydrogenase
LPTDPYQSVIDALSLDERERVRRDHSLGRYTSFRIGGPADLFYEPSSSHSLAVALAAAHAYRVPVTRLGGGTNVLISDRGIRGLVVRLGREFDYRRWSEPEAERPERVAVEVGAATRLARFVHEAVDKGLAGVEFAAGIPGTVGGGALMNAGAFGGELGAAIEGAQAVSLEGQRVDLDRSRLGFSYRKLELDVEVVITSVRFGLLRSTAGKLRRIVEAVQEKRRRKQPLGLPNAGSIFKNPQGEFAGRLIELAGLKGRTVGRAQVSGEHANFIVNLGGASGSDVHSLMSLVQQAVWERSGVWLEPEVRLVGDWGCG